VYLVAVAGLVATVVAAAAGCFLTLVSGCSLLAVAPSPAVASGVGRLVTGAVASAVAS
jgi:hypothetical protein